MSDAVATVRAATHSGMKYEGTSETRSAAATRSRRNPADGNRHLLEAFKSYAAAAEHARIEDWPDEAWRNWRYRRASLARLLAREGMLNEVADAYYSVK